MGVEGSLPCSQHFTTYPHPYTSEFRRQFVTILFKIRFNIVLPSTPGITD